MANLDIEKMELTWGDIKDFIGMVDKEAFVDMCNAVEEEYGPPMSRITLTQILHLIIHDTYKTNGIYLAYQERKKLRDAEKK